MNKRQLKEAIIKRDRIKVAKVVYLNKYVAAPDELNILGFTNPPSMEYLKDRVLETLAEAYVNQ